MPWARRAIRTRWSIRGGKVFGVSGLRVVDASAFPVAPPGHIMASVCECLLRRLLLA